MQARLQPALRGWHHTQSVAGGRQWLYLPLIYQSGGHWTPSPLGPAQPPAQCLGVRPTFESLAMHIYSLTMARMCISLVSGAGKPSRSKKGSISCSHAADRIFTEALPDAEYVI